MALLLSLTRPAGATDASPETKARNGYAEGDDKWKVAGEPPRVWVVSRRSPTQAPQTTQRARSTCLRRAQRHVVRLRRATATIMGVRINSNRTPCISGVVPQHRRPTHASEPVCPAHRVLCTGLVSNHGPDNPFPALQLIAQLTPVVEQLQRQHATALLCGDSAAAAALQCQVAHKEQALAEARATAVANAGPHQLRSGVVHAPPAPPQPVLASAQPPPLLRSSLPADASIQDVVLSVLRGAHPQVRGGAPLQHSVEEARGGGADAHNNRCPQQCGAGADGL